MDGWKEGEKEGVRTDKNEGGKERFFWAVSGTTTIGNTNTTPCNHRYDPRM